MFISLAQSELTTFLNRYENKNTRDSYRNSLTKFHQFLIQSEIYSLDSVTLEVGESFKRDLENNYAPKTAQMVIDCVKEFFKYLICRGMVSNNEISLVKSTKVCSRSQKTSHVTDIEIKKMLKVTYSSNSVSSITDRIMLIILFNVGLRESELAGLKLSHFKFQNGLYVIGVNGKGMRMRYLTFSKIVSSELTKLFNLLKLVGDDYIIQGCDRAGNYSNSKPISRITIFTRIKKIAHEAKVDKIISPHSLRRGCATHLYKLNTPIEVIQRILGHNSPVITSKYIASEIDVKISGEYALEIA